MIRTVVSTGLAWLGLVTGFGAAMPLRAAPQQADAADALKIVVLGGEDGVNIVKKKSAVRPVVEVRDRNNLPVAGASVVFLLPNFGATGTFANGGHLLTVLTDSAGRAAATGLRPVGTGTFKISVTASFHGQTATAAISQTNYLTTAAAQAAGASGGSGSGTAGAAGGAAGAGGGVSTGVVVGIVAAVGAVAAVAAKVLTGGKSSSTPNPTTPPTPTGTIGLGTVPVFGPPH